MTHLLLLCLCGSLVMGKESCWEENQDNHQISNLHSDNRTLNYLAWELDDDEDLLATLSSLLIVRPPESVGSSLVRDFIRSRLDFLGWSVDMEPFITTTLIGQQVMFTNVVGTLHPERPRHLVLACHYDSKMYPSGFLGATDSAVPCAIMLDTITKLDSLLKEKAGELGLQVIFFDGEEQLYEDTLFGADGLYGSKHLASKLGEEDFVCQPGPWCQSGSANGITRIDLMMLLDLVGGPDPQFRNMVVNQETMQCDPLFRELEAIEDSLRGVWDKKMFFSACESTDVVMDDHTPFLEQGLERVLHVIPDTFPQVWHTMEDDWAHLDLSVVLMVNRIVRVFVAEYLNLDVQEKFM